MITVKFNSFDFSKDMESLIQYSIGFTDGVQGGQTQMMKNLGNVTVELLKEFVDSNARTSPALLHHVYEWYHTGSPEARLFDVYDIPTKNKLSFVYGFRQSESIKKGSNVPFYDKARIMEEGKSVVIKPRSSSVLAFDVDGEAVFTRQPITVEKPGGNTQGQFERTLESFFNNYFAQSFMLASGLKTYLENPIAFKNGLKSAKIGGKAAGYKAGYKWISGAGGLV
jgi:hypothetical protein